jgi:hypothetical protein
MGDIVSSDILTGWDVTADQVRRVLEDLRRHHNHDGTKGAVIDHGDLTDGELPDTHHDHNDLRIHMIGANTSFVDNPGGTGGVHQLGSNYHVMGAGSAKPIVDGAKGITDSYKVIDSVYIQRGRAAYEEAYPEVPHATSCAVSNEPMYMSIHQRLTTSSAWQVCAAIPTSTKRDGQSSIPVHQLALGVVE